VLPASRTTSTALIPSARVAMRDVFIATPREFFVLD
jgi:hypothetical protein